MPKSNIERSGLLHQRGRPAPTSEQRREANAHALLALHDLPPEGVHLHDGRIRIPHLYRRSDEAPFKEFDLRTVWLPPTPFSLVPTSLTERPDLVLALCSTVKAYSRRLVHSKTFHNAVSGRIWVIARFFEYGWLHGCYTLADWQPAITQQLSAELASGGWTKALRIEERTSNLIATMSSDQVGQFLGRTSARGGYSVSGAFCNALGTNASVSASQVAKPLLMRVADIPYIRDDRDDDPRKNAAERGSSANYLLIELAAINSLADGDVGVDSLRYVPFPNAKKIADKVGRTAGRTENIGPEVVAALLVEATKWVNEFSGPIISLLTDVGLALEAKKDATTEVKKTVIHNAMLRSPSRAELEQRLGIELNGAHLMKPRPGEISISRLVHLLMTACFVTLAIFNARRRDELLHRRVGLHRNAMTVVDEALSLCQCEFYIEKTHRTYVPFFVGRQSQAAIRVLEQTSDLARRFTGADRSSSAGFADPRERTLFQVPKLHDIGSSSAPPTWFVFSTSYYGRSQEFVDRALGGRTLRVKSHMFRRAYALLFHYRYENSSLLALAQQLGHFDLETVSMYVTDAKGGRGASTASELFGKLTPAQRAAMNDHAQYMEEGIREVGRERVAEFVNDVLSGRATYSGGFGALVQRFHQKLGRRLEFNGLANTDQAGSLANRLIDRGHEFVPFPHGNCAASAGRPSLSAGCYSSGDRTLHRENASPHTCGRCPYHVVAVSHLQSLRLQHQRLSHEASQQDQPSFKQVRLVAQVESLGRAIELHTSRLRKEGVDA